MLHGATWHRGIDLIAIERVMAEWGPWPSLSEEELPYACREMSAADIPVPVIAERLGISERTVTRWRGTEGGGA
ncbi:helix-turn-helix domain-containing protein [Streptomyces sp. NPDC059916]|uniref:helix-turn-helix domain-containing protein n=1 Tax=Streptomyces sp. NPDC059916 TaxID=3347001 RepID=UPI0036943AD9